MARLILILALLVFSPAVYLPAGDEEPLRVNPAEEPAETESGEEKVSCLWKSILPDPDFQPEGGDIYRITVSGSDRENLSFSYRRLKPYPGQARIAVHTRKTPDNRILVDQENSVLFSAETGRFLLSLTVPPGWPIYLVEDPQNPYADPVILSNIVELP